MVPFPGTVIPSRIISVQAAVAAGIAENAVTEHAFADAFVDVGNDWEDEAAVSVGATSSDDADTTAACPAVARARSVVIPAQYVSIEISVKWSRSKYHSTA
jgi:hypothetical protein